tara:strand:- start:476 stop:940 length:465 start_codon:yes stop_codon:yes gene_type:complete
MSNTVTWPKYVIVVDKNSDKFKVSGKQAAKSEFLKTMMSEKEEDEEDEEDEEYQELPVPNVKGATLRKVFDFLQIREERGSLQLIKIPLKSGDITKLVDKWDAEFISGLNKEMLFKLTNAAVYLDIKSLMDLCCAKITLMIKAHTISDKNMLYF